MLVFFLLLASSIFFVLLGGGGLLSGLNGRLLLEKAASLVQPVQIIICYRCGRLRLILLELRAFLTLIPIVKIEDVTFLEEPEVILHV